MRPEHRHGPAPAAGADGIHARGEQLHERITPGLGDLGWDLFLRALSAATRTQRQLVAKALGLCVRDVRAIHGTEVILGVRHPGHRRGQLRLLRPRLQERGELRPGPVLHHRLRRVRRHRLR